MRLSIQTWMLMALFNVTVLILFCKKTFITHKNKGDINKNIKFTFTLLFVITAVLSMVFPRPTPIPIVISGVISFIIALFLSYSIAYSDLNNIDHHILQDHFTIITVFFCVIITILGYLNDRDLVYFIDNEPFKPTIIYYVYQYISYGFMLWLEIKLAKVHFRGVKQHKITSVRIRNTLIFIGWCDAILCFGAVLINLMLSHMHVDTFFLNNVFHSMKGFAALFIALGKLSQKSYNNSLDYVASKIDGVIQKQNECLSRLHQVVVGITPIVQLPDKSVRDVRIMSEIGNGCRVICTNIPRRKRISSKEMAKYIYNNQNTILRYGSHPPLQKVFFPRWYYLSVYKHLQNKQSTSMKGSNVKWTDT